MTRKTTSKKEYHGNLDPKKIADNRRFRRTVKSFLSDTSIENKKEEILVEKEEILTNDNYVAKVMNHFFYNTVKTLGISEKTITVFTRKSAYA